MNFGDIMQLGTVIVAIAAIVYTQIAANKQQRLAMFAEYTKRYQDIFLNMPDDIYKGEASVKDARTKKYMRLYFDLCSEEYHLWKEKNIWGNGIVPHQVWNLWLAGMRITCRHGIYNNSWDAVKEEYNDDFVKYFEDNVINYKEKE